MATTTVPVAGRVHRATARRSGLRLPVALGAVALAALAAGLVTGGSGEGGLTGSVAPSFSLPDVRRDGMTARLTPGRPTVVNFFAAWCVPCREELPVLEDAARRTAATVSFVGVDVNDSRSAAADMLAEAGVTFPAGYDPDGAVAGRYQLQGMPTTVFIDADGRVSDVARGRLTAADLDRRLDRLTASDRVGTS